MKVAFYVAHYPSDELTQFPLSVGYLAATIISRLNIRQENILFAKNLKEILSFRPDILAISSVSQVFNDVLKISEACRKAIDCITVLGGYHISSLPHVLPKTIDVGVIGEGEKTFVELINNIINGESINKKTLSNIKGICYHSNDTVLCNPPRPLIEDVDTIPHPFRSGKFTEDAYLFTSRGCLYNCIFCASCQFWGKIRYHSADYVLEEIRQLANRYKVHSINILDDVFIANRKRFFSIADALIKEGLNKRISFHGFVRANLIDEDIIKTLKKMNFNSIRFGAETGSDRILNYLKKGSVTVEQNQNLIDLCNKYKLPVGCSFVFGTPNETEDDLKKTTSFLEKNKEKAQIMGFYLLQAVPGTELWAWAKDKHLVSEDMDWAKLGLDLQKKEFSWKNTNYLNNETLPFDRFKLIIEDIREKYITCNTKINKDRYFKTIFSHITGIYSGHRIFVEVGSGDSPRDGYIHCDIYPAYHVEYVCRAWEIPFRIESVDEIYARHVLEHLTQKEAIRSLRHWLAILKTGGLIDINVPDLEQHIEQLNMKGNSPYLDTVTTNTDHAMAGIYGWQRNNGDLHKWGYTYDSLSMLLKRMGYINITRIEDDSKSGPLNLRIIAEKPYISNQFLPDPDSQKTPWTYYNWLGLTKKILQRIKISGFALNISKPYQNHIKLFTKDFSGRGDRQVSSDIDKIRGDHTGRYKFACRFIKNNDKVLDCACGVGYGSYIMSLHTDASLIIGVDKAREAIEYAEKYYNNSKTRYYKGDIFSKEISYGPFDVVVSFETIEHVDGAALLNVFNSKLNNGGLLVLSTPNQKMQPYDQKEFPTHLRHYTPEELEQLLSSKGFEIIEKYTQYNRENENISTGWDGLFNIAVARKI